MFSAPKLVLKKPNEVYEDYYTITNRKHLIVKFKYILVSKRKISGPPSMPSFSYPTNLTGQNIFESDRQLPEPDEIAPDEEGEWICQTLKKSEIDHLPNFSTSSVSTCFHFKLETLLTKLKSWHKQIESVYISQTGQLIDISCGQYNLSHLDLDGMPNINKLVDIAICFKLNKQIETMADYQVNPAYLRTKLIEHFKDNFYYTTIDDSEYILRLYPVYI